MKKQLLILWGLLSISITYAQIKSNSNTKPYPYGNPVIKHMYTADASPHVMPDGRVWMVTSVDHEDGGGYATMHKYHTFSSKDMVNWTDDAEVLKKIEWAKHFNKPVDGHAPGLRGNDVKKYISTGITTDHECFTFDEAEEKLALGMKVLIREGSAAKNFEALIDLLPENYQNMMFCSDDKHPDDLILGHINQLCARAVAKGMDVFKILQAACVNPVHH